MDFVLIWKFLSIFILSNILLGVNVRLFYIINISRHLPQQVIKMLVFCGSQNLFWGRERERERAVSKWIAKFTRKYVRKNLFQGLEAENSQKVPHHKLFLGIFMNFSRTCILQNTHKALLLNWPKTLWKLLIMLTNFERLTHCTNYHHFLFKSWSQRTLWKCNFVRGFWANSSKCFKTFTTQDVKFTIKNFFSKCEEIPRKLCIWFNFGKDIFNRKLHFLCSYSVSTKLTEQEVEENWTIFSLNNFNDLVHYFFYLLLGCPTANFETLWRGQPYSFDANYYILHHSVFYSKNTRNLVTKLETT